DRDVSPSRRRRTRLGGDWSSAVCSTDVIGLPEEDLDRMFQRFFRARNATDSAIPGTGLGLAICRGIVDAHGGGIEVESATNQGKIGRASCRERATVTGGAVAM